MSKPGLGSKIINKLFGSIREDNNDLLKKAEKKDKDGDVVMGDKDSDTVDRDFYDRQRRVLGAEAMKRMQSAVVLISGLSGLGVEIAKNIILSGVNAVYLHDEEKVQWTDLASNFYFNEPDVGSNRVDACIGQLKELNSYVKVERMKGKLNENALKKAKISVAVFTEKPVISLTKENKLCRKLKIRFLATEIRGLFGCVFSDMGEEFIIFDKDGEPPVECTVTDISNENPGFVTVHDDKINHGLGMKDKVIFYGVEGMEELNTLGEIEVGVGKGTGKHSFTICDTTNFGKYKEGSGYCKQVKIPTNMKYKSLEEAIKEPAIENYDFGKWDRGLVLHDMFVAMENFKKKNKGKNPRPYNEEDMKKFLEEFKVFEEKYKKKAEEKYKNFSEKQKKEQTLEDVFKSEMCIDVAKLLSYTYEGKVNPLAALIGGFTAQEIQKAVSGKFTPLNQWFYFDACECLPKELPTEEDAKPIKSKYDGQIVVFGKKFQEKLRKSKIFVVGAGALGCEYLKNFAMIGVGADKEKKGSVIITDMDNIEVSNLNRQFLFRNRHVGKMKSKCAAEAVVGMNTQTNVKAMEDKVAPETEEIFDADFWEGLDCVVNALDNIQARLYVDSKCVYFGKPLIEAGTLGPKANTQVVIPFLTESYGSQRDPPEKSYPQCTIKNFPYKIEHCISWARENFEGYFHNEPKNVNAYIKNPNFIKELKGSENSTSIISILEGIKLNLVTNKPTSYEDCVKWGRLKFEKHFHNDILQLLYNFPLEHITQSGMKFWSGSKRPPSALKFKVVEEWSKMFIKAAANIRAFVYGLKEEKNFDFDSYLNKMKIEKFVPKSGVKIKVEEEEEEEEEIQMIDEDKVIDDLLKELPKPKSLAGFELNVVKFEKDDDTNFHIDFITAASNSRASNYKIPHANKYKTKGIAGKIIPAMVTSTALITGFGCLEFYKVIQGKNKVEDYRNAYVNLALPTCTQSEPIPPKMMKYYDNDFSEWNKFTVNHGKDVTLREFLDDFKKTHNLEISSLNYGKALIYASFLPNPDNEGKPIGKLCLDITKEEPTKKQKYLDFVIIVEDDKGDDVDVPNVRYQFRFF